MAANTRKIAQGHPGGKRLLDASVEFGILITHADINVKHLSVAGEHSEFVIAYRGGHIETMNNTAWQRARREIGIRDLYIHVLRISE